jgi:hypothetical protein
VALLLAMAPSLAVRRRRVPSRLKQAGQRKGKTGERRRRCRRGTGGRDLLYKQATAMRAVQRRGREQNGLGFLGSWPSGRFDRADRRGGPDDPHPTVGNERRVDWQAAGL